MSSLWTPSGERPVGPDADPADRGAPPGSSTPAAPAAPGSDELSEEEARRQMAEVQRELVSVPAPVVIANHCIGLFQLAALHLDQPTPDLEQARLAIDAMAAVVEGLGSRLGEDEQPLRDALGSIQMGFVQVKAALEAGGQRPG